MSTQTITKTYNYGFGDIEVQREVRLPYWQRVLREAWLEYVEPVRETLTRMGVL